MSLKILLPLSAVSLILFGAGCASSPSIAGNSSTSGSMRVAVDCAFFGKITPGAVYPDEATKKSAEDYIKRFERNDAGYLPTNFPAAADHSTLCGSISDPVSDYSYLHSASFYISPLSSDDIYVYYKDKLTARGCTVQAIHSLSAIGSAATDMPFTCADGHGIIGPDLYNQSYTINFDKNK